MKMGACCSGGTTVDQVNLVDKGGGGSKNKVEPTTPHAKSDSKTNKNDKTNSSQNSKSDSKPEEPSHRPLLDQESKNQNKKQHQTVGNLPPPLTTKDGMSARVQKLEYNLSAIHPEEITELGGKLRSGLSIQHETENDNPDPEVNLTSLAEQLGTTDLTQTIWAASMIQRWYRKYVARLEQKRRATWKVFSEIEYSDEQDEIGLYNFFSGLLTKALPQIETLEKESANLGEVPTEAYTGVRINFPLTEQEVSKVKNHYKKEDKVQLHISYLYNILQTYKKQLVKMNNVHYIKSRGKSLNVIGDTHGSYRDLLLIFEAGGPPADNVYIFNGDFVDRGEYGLELLITLICYAILYPDSFILNRGNHEDSAVNVRYGFSAEVKNKYDKVGEELLAVITDVFRWLPLAIIVDKSILVVHGGVSPEFNLEMLDSIDRKSFPSILVPPTLPGNFDHLIRYFMTMTTQELLDFEKDSGEILPKQVWHWRYLMTLLWSDPTPMPGYHVNKNRGGGGLFGPNITETFLKRHGLKLLIRSHQCKPQGYEFLHDRKLLTIFSASNYYDKDSNKGAVVKFLPKAGTQVIDYHRPKILKFQVDLSKIKKCRKEDLIREKHNNALVALRYKMVQNMAKVTSQIKKTMLQKQELANRGKQSESDATSQLTDSKASRKGARRNSSSIISSNSEISEHGAELLAGTGMCKIDMWNSSCKKATGLEIPWMLLRRDLPIIIRDVEGCGLCVNYEETFEQIRLKSKESHEEKREKEKSSSLTKKSTNGPGSDLQYENQAELNRLFEMLDVDQSGTLEKNELVAACKTLPMFKGQDIDKLADMMDFNKDGNIDLNEFMEAFRLVLSGRA